MVVKKTLRICERINIMYDLLSKRKTKFKIYLCGPNDIGVKVRKIANEVVKIFKSKKKIIYGKTSYGWKGDVPNYNYNVSRLNKEGFKFEKHLFKPYKKLLDKIRYH